MLSPGGQKVFLSNEDQYEDNCLRVRIYVALQIILALPLYALLGYLWNATPLFQSFWGSIGVTISLMFYATSCLGTTVYGILTHDHDIETASNILGLISAVMIIPACIMVFGCVRVG